MNIAEILTKTSERLPNKMAFYFDDRGTTYQALQDGSESLALGLKKLGVQKGDRVGVFSPSSLEFVISWFAAVKLGAGVIPVNIMLKARESRYILENAEVSTLIVHHSQMEMIHSLRSALTLLKNLIVIGPKPLPESFLFADLLSEKPSSPMTLNCAPHDTATMIYTSGTTGYPKGAMITHANFYSNVQGIIKALALDEDMVRVSVTPLFHAMGLTVNMLAVVFLGASAVIQAKLDFEEFLKANEKYKATMISGAPALHYMLVHDPRTKNYDLSLWKVAMSGSAPLPVEVLRKFEEKFKIPMVEAYGLTEVTTAATANPVFGTRKPGSVGLPLPDLEVKIFDDQDHEVPTGEVGEVVIRGSAVMKGYYNNPEATAETLKGGWLHTGDLGKLDEDGYLYILDRKKDMIICSGYNVYPREVEELLHTHPAVMEAAVIGIPDPKRGESPMAFIIPRPGKKVTEEELIQFCKENLAPYKAIKGVKFVAEFPRNPNRKVLKRELREMLKA
ncbi:MAG: long-chain fatty acid--CoA ligase [Deltaproteobacteria bacterium]|nr:long-chain fatty acid--CoA ligase [Deltaproteobacteria bacterium]